MSFIDVPKCFSSQIEENHTVLLIQYNLAGQAQFAAGRRDLGESELTTGHLSSTLRLL